MFLLLTGGALTIAVTFLLNNGVFGDVVEKGDITWALPDALLNGCSWRVPVGVAHTFRHGQDARFLDLVKVSLCRRKDERFIEARGITTTVTL